MLIFIDVAPLLIGIEDNKEQVAALAMYAKGKGYVPKIAYDSTLVLAQPRQSRLGLVILDLGLPGGGLFLFWIT